MSQMSPEMKRFIDRFGAFFAERGVSRAAGRILAWIYVAEEPQSLDDLVRTLHVSKAAASQSTRLWERTGLVERVTLPGDRKVYFEINPGMQRAMMQTAVVKFAELARLAEEGMRVVGPEKPKARQRLDQMSRLYRHLMEQIPEIMREVEEA